MHACFVNDKYIVQAALDLLTNKMQGYHYEEHPKSTPLSNEEIKNMQKECPGINPIL